jgi:mycothiol synthase
MRLILKLHRPLTLEIPKASHNFEISSFDPELNKDEWLALNNKIFANHPDQGNWAMADLENRIVEPWFDPEGFFIAFENKKIIGFCWTKIHHNFVNQEPIGELYVLGVESDSQTKGVGRSLALTALSYLRQKGLMEAMLHVDLENYSALKLYESLGFK